MTKCNYVPHSEECIESVDCDCGTERRTCMDSSTKTTTTCTLPRGEDCPYPSMRCEECGFCE